MRHEEIKDKLKEVTENRRNQARQLMFECYQNNGELLERYDNCWVFTV